MSASRVKTRQEIIDDIPPSAVRVKVRDEKGIEQWRDIEHGLDTLADTDVILMDAHGQPMTMASHPGRRKKPKPQKAINDKVAEIQELRKHFYKSDELLSKIQSDVESDDVLHFVMQGLAREAASLEFERQQAENTGRETSQISLRRTNTLKAVADTWLKRKDQISSKTVDMNSTAFARLFGFIVETFRESLNQQGISNDEIHVIMTALSDRISDDTWEEEARMAMRGGD